MSLVALAPDVVLMDLHMPVLDGVFVLRRLRVEQPAVRAIALTTFDDDSDVFAALRAGAVGYLLNDVSAARLVEAVLAASRGESALAPRSRPGSSPGWPSLPIPLLGRSRWSTRCPNGSSKCCGCSRRG